LSQEEEKPTKDCEHGENEFSSNDDSEKIEWEQHYKRRNEKLVKEDEI
jgi:hypothetical protein